MALSKEDLAARKKAISEGKTEYTRPSNNTVYTIRNLNNKRWNANYQGQGGRDEIKSSRKSNRGSGTDSVRARNEQLSTPKGADRQAFGKAMTAASSKGMEGHHNTPIYLTGNALADMSPERQAEYHQRFKSAGVPIGNQAANITGYPPQQHRNVHKEGYALQNKLKQMQSRAPFQSAVVARQILNSMNQLSPLNQESAAYGGIEAQSNEYVQGMTGVSPMQLPLAD